MLIKIIRLHASLELPDGDCIGGRLQLESFLSCFFFSCPKGGKKKKEEGKRKKMRLSCVWDGCKGCLLLYTF